MSTTSNSNTQPALTGSCRCGKVAYSSTLLPLHMTNCHCKTCRKLSGGPYLTFGRFPISAITYNSSSTLAKTTYSEIADRAHCSECGSPISMQYKFRHGFISMVIGTIDEESLKTPLPKVSQDIFLAEKASWFEVPNNGNGECEQFELFPPSYQKTIDEWKKTTLTPEG